MYDDLTSDHVEAMAAVINGADVYSPSIARRLRQVEQAYPELIQITAPKMYDGDGTGRMPYFGAVLTDDGADFVREAATESAH